MRFPLYRVRFCRLGARFFVLSIARHHSDAQQCMEIEELTIGTMSYGHYTFTQRSLAHMKMRERGS